MAQGVSHRPPAHHHVSTARLLFTVFAVLGTLAGLAWAGTIAYGRVTEQRRLVSLMGRQGNFAELPQMDFSLGGARELELKVILEFHPKVNRRTAERNLPRIADHIYDEIRDIGPEGLVGPGSGQRVKQSVAAAVNRETGRTVVKDVLIERMVVK